MTDEDGALGPQGCGSMEREAAWRSRAGEEEEVPKLLLSRILFLGLKLTFIYFKYWAHEPIFIIINSVTQKSDIITR